MRFDRLKPFVKKQHLVRVVIETPKNSCHKYAFEPEVQAFILRRTLPEGMVFPFDFGFVPRTKGGDGDPMDVLVLADGDLFPGCVVECRIVGVIQARQEEEGKVSRNDRCIGVANASREFHDVRRPDDLPPHVLEQTRQFFVAYNKMAGKRFTPLHVLGPKSALKQLKASAKA